MWELIRDQGVRMVSVSPWQPACAEQLCLERVGDVGRQHKSLSDLKHLTWWWLAMLPLCWSAGSHCAPDPDDCDSADPDPAGDDRDPDFADPDPGDSDSAVPDPVGEDLCSDSDSSDPDPVMRLTFLFEESCSPCDKTLRGY